MNDVIWSDRCGDAETVRDGAERFIRDYFGEERTPIWGDTPGLFRFSDGYWWYQLSCEAGHWYVRRTQQMTPKAKARAKARRDA